MKILQWNVWVRESPVNIATEIQRLDVDIICAQELIQDSRRQVDTAAEIARYLGYDYIYQPADTWDNLDDKENLGNAIFSRFPIVEKRFVYLQEPKHNPPGASREGRVYLEARIQVGGRWLDVGCVHLSYSNRFEFTEERKEEVDNLISVVSSKKERYILCGDLNSTPSSYAIQQLGKYLQSAGPDYREMTWTTKPFDYGGFQEDRLNWRLDDVFATMEVRIANARIVDTPYSDHLPMLVEINTE